MSTLTNSSTSDRFFQVVGDYFDTPTGEIALHGNKILGSSGSLKKELGRNSKDTQYTHFRAWPSSEKELTVEVVQSKNQSFRVIFRGQVPY